MPNVGERIKDRLKELGYQQKGLAKYVGVHRNTVYDWIRGRMEPDLVNIYKIADFLRCDPTWLKWGDAPPKVKSGDVQDIIIKGNNNKLAHSVGYGNITQVNENNSGYNDKKNISDMELYESIEKLTDDQKQLIKGMINQMIKE